MDLKESFFQIKILHGALFVGILLFAGVCIVIHFALEIGTELSILPGEAMYLILLVASAMLYLSSYLYKKRTAVITQNVTLEEKINQYRAAAILRAALIETAALSLGIGYLLSGELIYLGALIIPLVYFAYTFPKEDVMIHAMDLTYTEQQKLNL